MNEDTIILTQKLLTGSVKCWSGPIVLGISNFGLTHKPE